MNITYNKKYTINWQRGKEGVKSAGEKDVKRTTEKTESKSVEVLQEAWGWASEV